MVPNHMGIDSRWVDRAPGLVPVAARAARSPRTRFNGAGPLDRRPRRHPSSRTTTDDTRRGRRVQAADRQTGDERYVYHGNDGTSFPWNDTAQLDYLEPEVREAVIQTILHVARQFPVIRFDAAMVLAKRHFQRLWFPEPGHGGGDPDPGRARHDPRPSSTAAMPHEFWREVVDRVAAEVPGTLLLAEAFWLLEGYFVRTLGMHRVYNSAFMNMLRDEDNAEYRQVMRNTLEFDPPSSAASSTS